MARRKGKPNCGLSPKTPTYAAPDQIGHGSVGITPVKSVDKTTHKTIEVTPEKSLNLMKIVSLAAFSEFAMSRGLFPADSFKQRVLDVDDASCTYTDFKKSELPSNDQLANGPGHNVLNILERQSHPDVDKFMDWIEIGAHDVLQKGYLASMRLTFYSGSITAKNVVESFELHFSEVDEILKTSTPSRSTHFQMSSAKQDAGILLYSLKNALRMSPSQPERQPDKLIVNMQLTYTQKSLKEAPLYQPPGFREWKDHRILHVGKSRNFLGEMSSGIQSMSAKWFHNNDGFDRLRGSFTSRDPTGSPQGHSIPDSSPRRLRRRSRFREILPPSDILDPIAHKVLPPYKLKRRNDLSLTLLTGSPNHLAPSSLPCEAKRSIPSQNLSTSSTPVQYREEKAAVRAKVNNPNIEPDTQSISQYHEQVQDVFGQMHDQGIIREESSDNQPARHEPAVNYVYSQKIIQMVLRKEGSTHTTVKEEAANSSRVSSRVACDCHVKDCQDEMLQCQSCLALQHPDCYGYTSGNEPDIHLCYKCLLQDNEPETMLKLSDLALKRRMLQYIMNHGYPRHKTQLQTYLGRSSVVVNKLNKELESEGYLRHNPKFSSKARVSKTSEYIFNDEAEQLQKLQHAYQDPIRHIAHLMELKMPDDGDRESLIGNASSIYGSPVKLGLSTHNIASALDLVENGSTTQGTPSTTASPFKRSPLAPVSREMSTQSSLPAPPFTPIAAGQKRKSPSDRSGHLKRLKQQ